MRGNMQKGGYQIIDLKGLNFVVGTAQTVDGIYDKIEGTKKPLYVSGIQIAGVEYHDTYVDFTVSTGNFVGTIYGKKITITADDKVTITAS